MRRMGREMELVSLAADLFASVLVQPQLAVQYQRPGFKRMAVHIERAIGLPLDCDNLLEALPPQQFDELIALHGDVS